MSGAAIVLILVLLLGGGILLYFFLSKKKGQVPWPFNKLRKLPPRPGSGTAFYLTCVSGPMRGRRFRLAPGLINLGRAPGNHIILDDPAISRLHASIIFRQGQTFLLDQGSRNGTALNQRRIVSRVLVPFPPGASVGMGRNIFLFQMEQGVATPPKPIASLELPDKPLPGSFSITAVIGEGAMARVYRGTDRFGKTIAIKIPKEEIMMDKENLDRFKRELQLGERLSHPNIVKVIHGGTHHGKPFIVMEYVEGTSLRDHLRRFGKLNSVTVLSISGDCLAGLEYAHEKQIVHRDIKPENIMLTSAGQAKITDFGVARCLTSGTITQAGTIIGALYYMSPEQAGAKEVDQRADIYSMGVVVYEMATGHRPFEGPDVATLIGQHLSSIPRNPKELQPDLPAEIERAIMRALEKDPDKRFQTAGEMAEALHCRMETIH